MSVQTDIPLVELLALSVEFAKLKQENKILRAQVKELTAQNWRLSSLERERNG